MSTLTSTAVQDTPSLSIAPTQNTAPVFEFRCLYTHDIRKKKKVWQDGSLRFHTFNRRVMVWDELKNYIGDVFVGKEGQVNEGDELRLDKGVLIDVAEAVGRTETDLAPLFERRRQDDTSSPARPSPQRSYMPRPSRPTTQGSQPRPKSLAAVLGAPRGQIGRAQVAAHTPYEQRHQQAGTNPLEDALQHARPTKRRRTAADIGMQQEQVVLPQSGVGNRVLTTKSANARLKPTVQRTEPMLLEVIDVSSDPSESSRPLPSSPAVSMTPASASLPRLEKPQDVPVPQLSPSRTSDEEAAPRKPTEPTMKSPACTEYAPRQCLNPTPPVVALRQGPTLQDPARPLNVLQFSKAPARKKLMYRDLLSGNSALSSRPRPPAPDDSDWLAASALKQAKRVQERLSRSESRAKARASTNGPEASPVAVEVQDAGTTPLPLSRKGKQRRKSPRKPRDSKSPPKRMKPIATTPRQATVSQILIESPLFFPESPSSRSKPPSQHVARSPSSTPSPLVTASPVRSVLGAPPPQTILAASPTASEILERGSVATRLESVITTYHDAETLPPYVLNSKHPLVQKELQLLPPKSIEPRPFRRVHSENDISIRELPSHSPPEIPVAVLPGSLRPDPPTYDMNPPPIRPSPRLRKSVSDLTGLSPKPKRKAAIARTAFQGNAPTVEEQPADTDVGPWSTEAAWLFDWWPAGRERPAPVLQDNDIRAPTTLKNGENGNNISEDGGGRPRCARGFESAGKAFLSERIAAL